MSAAAPLVCPFAALRPVPARAAEVAAPPYDVVTAEEARDRAEGNPWSFLRVSRPEIDLPDGADPRAPEAYAKAAENIRRMIAAGVLRRDREPHYYVYRLRNGEHVQTGVVAAASVEALEEGRIRRHELTRPPVVADRMRHAEAVNAHTGPVMMAHRPDPELSAIVGRVVEQPPACVVRDADGVEHSLWVVSDPSRIERITRAFDRLDALYIADGHHRSDAAAGVAAGRRAASARHRPGAPHERFLAVAFASDEMRILAYNRAVRDLNGLTAEAFLARLGGPFIVEPRAAAIEPARPHEFAMYLGGRWYGLTAREAPAEDAAPLARLGVTLLSDRLLGPILAIGDHRSDPRIESIAGALGLAGLRRRVDGGAMAVAFAIAPPSMADLMAVADGGDVMPPKCTWFDPKLADGLVSYPLD